MTIINNGTRIETSVTPNGNFMIAFANKHGRIMKTTADPQQFVKWMCETDVREAVHRQVLSRRVRLYKLFWNPLAASLNGRERDAFRQKPVTIRASFNAELYAKVLEAKNIKLKPTTKK